MKMSDFNLLKYYQQLLVDILDKRQKSTYKFQNGTKARFNRVRIETQKLMYKIECKMDCLSNGKEKWE